MPSTSTTSRHPAPTFESLGVRTLINARGTYTILTGSRALPAVAEAMREATNHYVDMDELMDRVGARLAELTGAEWGYISSGCAAALAEVTAACIAGADPEKMARLPDVTGMRHEVVMQAGHRNSYDRAVRMAGARVVEVVTEADLEAAIGERTAMVLITGDQSHLGEITTARTIEIGHRHGVPCMVDAAAERPDLPNVYLQMGADAVAYSGGKCLRGPQASGLVLGRKDLLQAAFLHAAPHHGLGRPMKAGKEEIMGLLAAVEAWVRGRDHQAEWRAWEVCLECIADAVRDLPSVRLEIEQPGVANVTPTLSIRWDPLMLDCSPTQVHHDLVHGDPRIALHLLPDGLRINPYMMEAGDDAVVAERLRALLSSGEGLPEVIAEPPAVDVSGTWLAELTYVFGSGRYGWKLEQQGQAVSGTCRTPYACAEVRGSVHGRQVALRTRLGYEANMVAYAFQGELGDDGVMSGELAVGEYGRATWRATRAG